MQNQLCLYCGQAGHVKISCPVCPSTGSRSVSDHVTTSPSSIKLPVKIRIQVKVTTTTALIDSGAAGNFVSLEFAQQHKLKLTPCNSPMAVEALDDGEGRVSRITEEVKLLIGTLHSEFIKFYIIHSPNHPIIFGLPWLCTHNPHISWREGQIFQWGTMCQERCLSKIPKPLPPHLLQPFRTQLTPTCPLNTLISPKHSAKRKHLNFQLTARSIVP